MTIRKRHEPDWDIVKSPSEIKEMFNDYFNVVKTAEGKFYINSDYLVERTLEVPTECFRSTEALIDVIRHTYFVLREESKNLKKYRNLRTKN